MIKLNPSLTKDVKPGLHRSRKDRKHIVADTFLSFSCVPWSSIIAGIHISQEIFETDVLTALKSYWSNVGSMFGDCCDYMETKL